MKVWNFLWGSCFAHSGSAPLETKGLGRGLKYIQRIWNGMKAVFRLVSTLKKLKKLFTNNKGGEYIQNVSKY